MSVVELPGTTLLATVAAALLLFVSGGVIYLSAVYLLFVNHAFLFQ